MPYRIPSDLRGIRCLICGILLDRRDTGSCCRSQRCRTVLVVKRDREHRLAAEARDDAAARAQFAKEEVASVARVPAAARVLAPSDPDRHAAFATSLRDAMAEALRVLADSNGDAERTPESRAGEPQPLQGVSENRDPPAPHAEVAGAAGPRSTQDRGASFEAPLRSAPQDEEFGGLQSVARAEAPPGIAVGCAMCRGYCCGLGGDHGFLTPSHLAARLSREPGLSSDAMMAQYLARLPARSEAGSCVFHGELGCVLDRDERSDICNDYRCDGLRRLASLLDGAAGPVGVAAVREGEVLRSTVIDPAHLSAASPGV